MGDHTRDHVDSVSKNHLVPIREVYMVPTLITGMVFCAHIGPILSLSDLHECNNGPI